MGLIFKHCNTVCAHFCYLLPCCFYIFILQKPISTIHIALVSPSLRQYSAYIQIIIVFGVLGAQQTFYYLIAGLFERDHRLPWIDNLRSSTWGKFATVLQNSALGCPTTSTRIKLRSRHHQPGPNIPSPLSNNAGSQPTLQLMGLTAARPHAPRCC